MRIVTMCALALSLAATAAAQPPDETPSLSIRPLVFGSEQAFAAANTFDAVFGESRQPFFGGGIQVVLDGRIFVEADASRFKKTGERAFRSGGQNFRLGLPLTAEIRPLEITAGYRFHFAGMPRVIPYAAGGFGSYGYTETSPSSDPSENVDVRHSGVVLYGGAEFRLHRWIGVAAEVQYTHIPGILGSGGISLAAGEDDLGGVVGRVKFVVGR